jgi:putative ABC transport system ATP-binding protein
MIRFDHVTVRANHTTLLSDLSFSVDTGQKAVIGGPTGSGKSTVLLTLLGAYRPVRGTVSLDGMVLSEETATAIRKKVAYIAQEPVLGSGKVREGLLLPFTFTANRHLHPGPGRLHEVLEALRLPRTILDRDSALVSGGEKQRIVIARALLMGKKVFVVDEITSALDEESNRVVLDLFVASAFTVLAVAHHPRWQRRFDKLITVHDGRVAGVRTRPETDV